jgi:hypothetical protein
MEETISVIEEAEKFYGYIVGLTLEPCPNPGNDPVPSKLYATFEYNGEQTRWIVPDVALFRSLAAHLIDMAVMRSELGDHGYSKLWISKKDGQWLVDLP